MAESRKNQLGIEQIVIAGGHRWLRPTEICDILRNYQKFHLAPEPPDKPPSGSVFLFERHVVRRFKQDGHNWRKEAHDRVKAGGIDVLNCYYAHGEENENFQRHCYWMLEEKLSHIVFVHYREVKTSEDDSSHLSNQPNDQKLYSDSVHDDTSTSCEQEVACDDLYSPQPPHTHPNMQNDIHVRLSNPERGHSLNAYLKFLRKELSISTNSVPYQNDSAHLSNWPADQKSYSYLAHNHTSGFHEQEVAADYLINSLQSPCAQPHLQNDLHAQPSNAECGHLLKSDLESNLTIKGKSICNSAIKKHLFDGSRTEGLKRMDSFYSWMSLELGDVRESLNIVNGTTEWKSVYNSATKQHLFDGSTAGTLKKIDSFDCWMSLDLGDVKKSLNSVTDTIEGKSIYNSTIKQHFFDGSTGEGLKKIDSFDLWMSLELGDVKECLNIVNDTQETKTFENDSSHLFNLLMDQKLYSDTAHNLTSTRHDIHAAATRIQSKFHSWKGRKNFLIIRQQIIKIQAYVRGHQVRKNYKKLVWSAKLLQKLILRWRQKRSGLHGFKPKALTEGSTSMLDTKNFDFRASEDVLQNCCQGHDVLGELSINRFGEQEEFGSHLTVDEQLQVFNSKEALIQWTQEFGRKNGFGIVIKRSDLGNGGPKPRITFCCERGGWYRNIRKNKVDGKEEQLRNTNTKKCGCPFTLKGRKLSSDANWMLKEVFGVHNHPITKPLKGRSYAGRLSKKENVLLIDMLKSKTRPKDILGALKNRDANNVSTIKQIYNARQRYNRVIKMTERSQTQQLLSKLSEQKYIEWHRSFDNSNIIKDLLWGHPFNIDLLRAFPHVLVMDTYKTNKYNLPILEIEGVTSTNMSFVVAFAYLEFEREDNYMWALEKLRSVMDDNALPTVILSDKKLALMNSIARIFPTAKHLLLRWNIHKNVLTNCKKLFGTNEMWEKFIMSWNVVVLSSNEDEFIDHLNSLKQEFSNYPQAIEHVTNAWLNDYKERLVSAWTNKIMHFGNLTKNRVGSSHLMLKKQLRFYQGNFEISWAKIHSFLELQHKNIRASLAKSLALKQDQFKAAEFKELRGFVSIDALHMILGESKRANSIGIDGSTCGCIIRRTHGLPCAHEIAEFKRTNRSIPLESMDSYWRKLDLAPVSNKQKAKLSYESVLDLIAKRIDKSDEVTKVQILEKLIEIANPQSTSLMESEANRETHGQPNSSPTFTLRTVAWRPTYQVKKNKRSEEEVHRNKRLKSNTFVNSFPVGLLPFIHDVKDVAADGNCGFRAIADLLGFGENEWLRVRKDLLKELNLNSKHYSLLYGSNERVKELIHALSYFESRPSFNRWMTMPDMGHLIASAYNVVLFHLSSEQCLTFLPLRSMPIPSNSRKDIAIGFVNNNHFVEVFLLPDHPVPPIATNWHKFHYSSANGWETVYIPRIQHFIKIIGNDVATNETIDIDSNSFSDKPVHAAAIRIQSKFRSWTARKDFFIIQQQIVKIQAHVRGHQVRKNYKKMLQFSGVGMLDTSCKEDDFEFLKEGGMQPIGSTGIINHITNSEILQNQQQQQQQIASLATKSSVQTQSPINNFLGLKVVPLKHLNSGGKPRVLYRGVRRRKWIRWVAAIRQP